MAKRQHRSQANLANLTTSKKKTEKTDSGLSEVSFYSGARFSVTSAMLHCKTIFKTVKKNEFSILIDDKVLNILHDKEKKVWSVQLPQRLIEGTKGDIMRHIAEASLRK